MVTEKTLEFSELSERLQSALYRFHREDNSRQFCDWDGHDYLCHQGYVTLLPMFLNLLDQNSSTFRADLLASLESIADTDKLAGACGIRSLSEEDEFYLKGDAYWTGPCWQPFHYLALAALKERYSEIGGREGSQARQLYEDLRERILQTVVDEWAESDQIFEQYSDKDGSGQRGKSFTGWSSLVVLMMAEIYNGVV